MYVFILPLSLSSLYVSVSVPCFIVILTCPVCIMFSLHPLELLGVFISAVSPCASTSPNHLPESPFILLSECLSSSACVAGSKCYIVYRFSLSVPFYILCIFVFTCRPNKQFAFCSLHPFLHSRFTLTSSLHDTI